jgi:creatinine amidohydrolase
MSEWPRPPDHSDSTPTRHTRHATAAGSRVGNRRRLTAANYVLASIAQEANTDDAIRVGLCPSRDDWTEARHAAGISSTTTTICMPMNSKHPSCSRLTRPTYARAGRPATTPHPIAATLTTLGISAYTKSGVIGYPSRANADKGHLVLNHLGEAAGKLITLLTDRQI